MSGYETLETVRMYWKHDAKKTDDYVDGIVAFLKDNTEAKAEDYMALDMPYRNFLYWMHSAKALSVDADKVRNAAVNLFVVILLEMTSFMHTKEGDREMSKIEWISDFLKDVISAAAIDIEELKSKRNQQ